MLRRLHHDQPESFAFTPANLEWAKAQITKYPEGRQASAIIPLLWRAQEQEGWLTRPAIEYVADMLGMAHIRALEVATFYFMFQLHPVGSVAHVQICGTTTCMICGSGELIEVCRERIAPQPHMLSADGKFSWEEVECLGSCSNAPMAQIGKDYYEDLTAERLAGILDELAAGKVPVPGPQNGRFGAEPLGGPKVLTEGGPGDQKVNASVALATRLGDTVKRIDGTEVPLLTPWLKGREGDADGADGRVAADAPAGAGGGKAAGAEAAAKKAAGAKPAAKKAAARQDAGADAAQAADTEKAAPSDDAAAPVAERRPETLSAPREGGPDDLKKIKGVGPKLEALLHELGVYHFDQIAAWTPEEVAWVDERLSFKGRIGREGWIEQARALAAKKDRA